MDVPAQRPPIVASGHVYCRCGQTLLDRVDAVTVTLGDLSFAFRRTSDHVVCALCHDSYPVGLIRAMPGATPQPSAA